MRVNLDGFQRRGHRGDGQITGADGVAYLRVGTKMKRAEADARIATGVPLVLLSFGERFEWADGDDARQVWLEIRSAFRSHEPSTNDLKKGMIWTGGLWRSHNDEEVIYLVGHH